MCHVVKGPAWLSNRTALRKFSRGKPVTFLRLQFFFTYVFFLIYNCFLIILLYVSYTSSISSFIVFSISSSSLDTHLYIFASSLSLSLSLRPLKRTGSLGEVQGRYFLPMIYPTSRMLLAASVGPVSLARTMAQVWRGDL